MNASDSKVTIGCRAKGRSSSLHLNARLRGSVGHQVLGRTQLANFHVGSKHCVADDPSRFVELRKPKKAQKWLKKLFKPSRAPSVAWSPLPALRRWAVEAYSGHGSFSRFLRREGLWALSLEAFPQKKMYLGFNDVDPPLSLRC